ncbi:MAG TPA: hypothetical protein VFA80_15135 [Xanthobacteraceae bacterium]|nr:hypothetical protein [Xanthobacteraceae bacterium]
MQGSDATPDPSGERQRALERDAVQFTKDYSLFVLRTCVLLHGGAIIALLGLLSAIIGHPESKIINVTALRWAIGAFAIGLVATVGAGICGYFNFLAAQARDSIKWNSINTSRIWATLFTFASLALFVIGVATVVIPW